MDDFKSGAIEQRDYRNITHADRDAYLGQAVQAPDTFVQDISWLTRNIQRNIPACSAHALSHYLPILNLADVGPQHVSPMFSWRDIKTFDGFTPDQGTSIEALFKSWAQSGSCKWDMLPTDYTLDEHTQAYTPNTQEEKDDAQPRICKSYAITYKPTQDEIRQAIYQDKGAILLLRFDNSWWQGDTLETNGNLDYGHFVCAYGYDKDYIHIIDSADNIYPYKKLGRNFSVVAIGTAVDLPDDYVRSLVKQRSLLQQIVELYRKLKALIK